MQKPLPTKFSDETGNYDGNDPQGSANLTFTRNSNASRVTADGKVERVRTNLALYSQDFSNAAWPKGNCTVAGSQADPNGGTSAFLFTDDATNDLHYFYQFVTPQAGEFTFSFYAKANTLSHCGIRIYDGGIHDSAIFNLSNGTKGSGDGSIESVGNGWYRVSLTKSIGGSFAYFNLFLSNGSTYIYSGSGQSIYVFGAQYESGVMTPYIPTTTSARSTFAGITVDGTSVPNVPRLDYSGGATCGKLILESQRTNLIRYSEQMDNASWSKENLLHSENYAVSPDGYQNADKIIPTTSIALHRLRSNTVSISASGAYSIFVKADGYSKVAIREDNAVGHHASFDLSTGTLIEKNASGEAGIESYGNDWYRIYFVDNAVSTVCQLSLYVLPDSYTSGAPTLTTWAGDGTKGVLAYGVMVEEGTYPSSYIGPTLGASVTRLADSASRTNIANLIGQTEGTLFVDFNVLPSTLAGSYYLQVALNDGTTSNQVAAAYYADGRIQFAAFAGGSLVVNINLPSYGLTVGKHKFAFAYKLNDYVAYVDGVSVGTDTSASIGAMSKLDLYMTSGGTNDINQALVFKTRLTNAQLAELTTL